MFTHGRRALALIAMCLVLVSVVTACAPPGTTPARASNKQIELTMIYWPGLSRQALDEVIEEFNKKRPNVKIRVRDPVQGGFGGGGQGGQLNPAVLEGVDMALMPRNIALNLFRDGKLRDLSNVRLPQLNDAAANLYDDLSREAGKRFGLPYDITPTTMILNETGFNNANVMVPPVDWTVQEFEQTLAGLKAAGRLPHLNVNAFLEVAARAFGGQIYDTARQAWAFDTPEAKQALAWLGRLVQDGLLARPGQGGGQGGFGGPGGPNQATLFAAPAGANFMIGGHGGPVQFRRQPYPRGPRGRSVPASASLAVVLNASPNPEVATDFIRELVGTEAGQVSLANAQIRPVMNNPKALTTWQQRVGERTAQAVDLSLQNAYVQPTGVAYQEFLQGLVPYFEGKVGLDQVLSDLKSRLNP